MFLTIIQKVGSELIQMHCGIGRCFAKGVESRENHEYTIEECSWSESPLAHVLGASMFMRTRWSGMVDLS